VKPKQIQGFDASELPTQDQQNQQQQNTNNTHNTYKTNTTNTTNSNKRAAIRTCYGSLGGVISNPEDREPKPSNPTATT
jgi:hypothetical protein